MFVSSFYCYLNYHKTNDYVIDLDNVWQWLGFSQKVNAKRVLEKNFTIDKDYKTLLCQIAKQTSDTRGGHNKETFLLTVKTFKSFCMKAGTKRAEQIHEYYIKLELILNREGNIVSKQKSIQETEYNRFVKTGVNRPNEKFDEIIYASNDLK